MRRVRVWWRDWSPWSLRRQLADAWTLHDALDQELADCDAEDAAAAIAEADRDGWRRLEDVLADHDCDPLHPPEDL